MKTSAVILVILVAALGFILWQRFFRNDFNLPRGGITEEETITLKNGQVLDSKKTVEPPGQPQIKSGVEETQTPTIETKKIMTTNGTKHSVPLDEILGGGPPKDGIPSIDSPKFVAIAEANKFLQDTEPGIALDIDGVKRFYPFQILVWHEIVNDIINGKRVLVIYCPLCLSGIVFDPVVCSVRSQTPKASADSLKSDQTSNGVNNKEQKIIIITAI